MKNKIIAFDFLRALAIIMIIPAHLSSYLFSTYGKLVLYAFDPYFANMGLGLFIFMSGYLLYYNNHSINSLKNISEFYKKRLFRIYPLYWAALALFVMVFFIFSSRLDSDFIFPNSENVFGLHNMLVHMLGLQILLSPAYATPMLTLYFVGLIVFFYLFYPFIIMYSKSTGSLVLSSFIIYSFFFLISKTFNVIDHRFFMFFPVFISGVIACRENLFKKAGRIPAKIPFVPILMAVLPILFVLTIVLGLRSSMFLDPNISVTVYTENGIIGSSTVRSILNSIAGFLGVSSTLLEFLVDVALLNVFILTFCAFEYSLAMRFVNDKLSNSLNSFFTYIATSSYCVYLFHRPFFTLWNSGTNFISSPILRDIIMLFVAIPLLFFISYHIQKIELNLKNNISSGKFHMKKLPYTKFKTYFSK